MRPENRDDEEGRVTNARPLTELATNGRHATSSAEAAERVRSRRELLGALRRIALNLETADVLELRADRSASPALAVVLRERAAHRRRTAGRVRAGLAAQGAPPAQPVGLSAAVVAAPDGR
jgi:hypothetical protein